MTKVYSNFLICIIDGEQENKLRTGILFSNEIGLARERRQIFSLPFSMTLKFNLILESDIRTLLLMAGSFYFNG